ncbi:MAG: nickel pincer cofactor biosynthesis protein LarC [Sporomusaceae bacterium]|nr:nickel pincer cofactor biosynthesis protein LarC [Sporomusaceae bacterium]
MKAIYLDCFSGISGNMLLGALLEVGLPEAKLREALQSLPLDHYEIKVSKVNKLGIAATYVDVVTGEGHHHRHLPDIYKIIDQSALNDQVKVKSKAVFTLLGEAEAKVHGTTIDHVHFHEVGAVDSIVDIVGIVFALDYLGIEAVYASKVHVGSGLVRCSHGFMPVPAPATAELLKAIPTYSGQVEKELATPTGAAILAAYGKAFGDKPTAFATKTIGYGAGSHELSIPNVLRLYLGDVQEAEQELWVLEANIDDSTPQVLAYTVEKLLALGACDAWITPIVMKKGRSASMLSVLAEAAMKDTLCRTVFDETSTIGMRFYPVNRAIAERTLVTAKLSGGDIAVKISTYEGKIIQIMPEYDDCATLAKQTGQALKSVQEAAKQAVLQKS